MKIRGSSDQVFKQVQRTQQIHCRQRFAAALNYFSKLEEKLRLFDIYAESKAEIINRPFETKKELAG